MEGSLVENVAGSDCFDLVVVYQELSWVTIRTVASGCDACAQIHGVIKRACFYSQLVIDTGFIAKLIT